MANKNIDEAFADIGGIAGVFGAAGCSNTKDAGVWVVVTGDAIAGCAGAARAAAHFRSGSWYRGRSCRMSNQDRYIYGQR